MGTQFASGKHSIAMCDRCGQQFKLKQLKKQIVKQQPIDLLVCPECLDEDHPQLMLGTFPIYDPQAVRNPRVDNGLVSSRDIQWGWNPVGGSSGYDTGMTPNNLIAVGQVGTVTVITT